MSFYRFMFFFLLISFLLIVAANAQAVQTEVTCGKVAGGMVNCEVHQTLSYDLSDFLKAAREAQSRSQTTYIVEGDTVQVAFSESTYRIVWNGDEVWVGKGVSAVRDQLIVILHAIVKEE